MIRPLIELEREKPRNARLWDGSVPDVDVTPVADVKNASTRADAFRGDAVITTVREDLFKRPEPQHTRPEPQTETTMAYQRATPEQIEERRERLRAYLTEHGPTDRIVLVDALGYRSGRTEKAARFVLADDLRELGVRSGRGARGPVSLDSVAVVPTKRRRAEAPAETEPVRPSLAADAIRYLREGAEGPGVILPVEYCRALVARLEEAGL